jgi:Sir2 family
MATLKPMFFTSYRHVLKNLLAGQQKQQQHLFCRAKSYFGLTTGRPENVNSSLEAICETIAASEQILVMAGAGLSTASGIPDFRSPTSGLYSNLSRYNLPYPEAIFEIEYFRQNPTPFNTWAKEFLPGINYMPNKGLYSCLTIFAPFLLDFFSLNISGSR